MKRIRGFPAISAPDAAILILGSMPGRASLAAHEYYAQPHNAFWKIMSALLGFEASLPYPQRCARLVANRIALWDVLKSCTREGSLDSDIVDASIVTNDFRGFFRAHPRVQAVFFNGAKSQAVYRRHVLPKLSGAAAALPAERLPSTSPAHASLNFEAKLRAWREVLNWRP